MNKLALLDELILRVHTGEIELQTEPCREFAERMLQEIKMLMVQSLERKVWEDITNPATSFYAPDFESWKKLLNWADGNEDYAAVLEESYTEEELGSLWNASHVVGALQEQQIKEGIFRCVSAQRTYEMMVKLQYVTPEPQTEKLRRREILARIKGYYGVLYAQ